MNDQLPNDNPPPEVFDRREARQQRQEARRAAREAAGGGWAAGLILILLGVVFLLRTQGLLSITLNNWWALFILIPAIGAFETALRLYRSADQRFTAPVRGSLLVGLSLTLVTLIFLFDLSWTIFGPILIILIGLTLLASALLPQA